MSLSNQSISESRLLSLNQVVGSLYEAVDSPYPESHLMQLVREVVPCETAVLNAIALQPNRLVSWSSARRDRRDISGDPTIAEYLHYHPTLEKLIQTGVHDAVRLSDTGTKTVLNRNPLVRDYYNPSGLRHQLTMSVGRADWVVGDSTWIIGLHRFDKLDFHDEDLVMANLMRPHIERVLVRLQHRREREAISAIHEAAHGEANCGTLVVRLDGTVIDAHPMVLDIITRWFGHHREQNKLPPSLCHRLGFTTVDHRPWVKAVNFEGDGGASLRIQVTKPSGKSGQDAIAGLWIKESPPIALSMIEQTLGLTPRQAAIALWISLGKTNAEIAVILGISQRTVDKHLELMLQRLPVENRHGIAETIRHLV